jgi:hypothetical protein
MIVCGEIEIYTINPLPGKIMHVTVYYLLEQRRIVALFK